MKGPFYLVIGAAGAAALIFTVGACLPDDNPTPTTPAAQPAAVSQPATIPACKWEDGSDSANPCLWDAEVSGNGEGLSFIVYNDEFYYLEGGGLNTRIEGDPFAKWPTGPLSEYDPGVLMCGTVAAPAEDTDGNGNHWAYCEPALVTE